MTFKIIKELGRGGFGIVHEIVDESGAHLARKLFDPNQDMKNVIAKGHITLEELKKRFFKEVKYQSKVDSKNVVKILRYDLDATQPWYLMELALGTLQDDLNVDRTLSGKPGKALFDILSGLEAIHDMGIVHRDLKPVNVLQLNNSDSSVRYAISDFGLITAVASDTTTITRTGHGGGTPIYAAPELITNFKYATSTADIYSFGAILHDIFGGGSRTPYVELTVPGPCRAIVEKCTKKNPSRRYQNIAELRSDLFEALNSPDINFGSTEEADIVSLLNSKDELSDDEWDRFFEVLEHANVNGKATYNLFRAIRHQHMDGLAFSSHDLMNSLGMQFSEYVRRIAHDFDYCDVLADKLEKLFTLGTIALKSHVLLSLLIMGVEHNRWFVERKFAQLAGSTLDDKVAQRFMVDVEADSIDLERYLSHLERSITTNRESLHLLIRSKK